MTEQEAINYIQSLANRIPLKFFTDEEIKKYDEFSQIVVRALKNNININNFAENIKQNIMYDELNKTTKKEVESVINEKLSQQFY